MPETKADKIARLTKAYTHKDPKTGEPVRHEWIDAIEAQSVFVKLFSDHPDYQFGKTFPVMDKGRFSDVPDYWSSEIHYGKFRNGKSGWLTDKNEKVREDVPIMRRYVIGRAEGQNKLIRSLLETFNVFPDNFPNKDKIISNLKSQIRTGKTKAKAAPKPSIKVGETREFKVASRSTCSNIPMTGLFQAAKGNEFSFDQRYINFVSVELCDDDGIYYKVRPLDKADVNDNYKGDD